LTFGTWAIDILENPGVAGDFKEPELMEARLVFRLSPEVMEFVVGLFLEKRPMVDEDGGLYNAYRSLSMDFESGDVWSRDRRKGLPIGEDQGSIILLVLTFEVFGGSRRSSIWREWYSRGIYD